VPSAKVQIFTFDFLYIALTNLILISLKMTFISTPIICIEASNIKGFELLEYVILAPTKYISEYRVSGMVNGVPQPTLVGFVTDIRPLFVHLNFKSGF
jgi:hypothetical protein